MTLPELERWFALQVHAYHSTIHSNLNVTPLTAWKRAVSARDNPIRQMTDADQRNFFIDLLPGERRKIRRDGIRLFDIQYWNNILSPIAGRLSTRVLVKFDPRDLSTIYYQDELGSYWAIPYSDFGAPPIPCGNIVLRSQSCELKANIRSTKTNYFQRFYSSARSSALRKMTWHELN
jgi:putative transposase